ncbi:hypothetical protein [Geoglobus acetivorans]|uniref:Uncharacterized protein n=1 Tax=Geoglobus acetivorans TaxID=565033 RepID=A0A0A7GGY5_GEOAI|nr:hypothetical protein GACE_2106 [Geoglobus acetivorans]
MWIGVECVECGAQNVVSLSVDVGISSYIALEDIKIQETVNFDIFFSKYRHFITELSDFPVSKQILLRKIKDTFNCSFALANDILERLKIDLGLYEQNGVIYEA